MTNYNIIFVCDECLKELVIPNKDFDPFEIHNCPAADGWIIPYLVQEVVDDRGRFIPPRKFLVAVTASSVACYCPEHGGKNENT